MSLIKFNHVFHTYNPKTSLEYRALKDINFVVKKNDFLAIIGHTGSGKSTLIQHINGLLKPTKGTINIAEFIITQKRKQKSLIPIRRKAALVFQFPEMQLFCPTVKEDIEFGPKNYGVKPFERAQISAKVIKMVGLDETFLNRSPFELSGGQQRRVAIAGILALEPEILILDEPTAGLDPKGKKQIMELLKSLQQDGLTIILVTHNMDDVLKYANTALILEEGKKIYQGNVLDLFKNKKFLDKMSIDLPAVSYVIYKLNQKDYNLSFNIRNIDDLVKAIIRERQKG